MAYDQATTYETIEIFSLTEKDAHLPIPQDDILKDGTIREAFEFLLGQLRYTGREGEIERLAYELATILQRRKGAPGKECEHLMPLDEKTVDELSKAVGKTTKTVVTKSRSIGKNPFEGRSQSARTEEASLLPEDEARRLPLDEIVVVDVQMPVRAKRIKYFDNPFFRNIHAARTGKMLFSEDQ